MINFDRAQFTDELFSQLGRAIIISTNFENKCKMLSTFINFKRSNLFDNEDNFKNFTEKLLKSTLNQSIKNVQTVLDIKVNDLNAGRLARNEIVHDFPKYLDEKMNRSDNSDIVLIKNELLELVQKIAKADLIISFLLNVCNKEQLPNNQFLKNYENSISQWVINNYE
jgi:hypothetical protein